MSKEVRDSAVREIIKTNQENEENQKYIHLEFKGVEEGFGERKVVVDKEKLRAEAKEFEREIINKETAERNKILTGRDTEDWSKSKDGIKALHDSVSKYYKEKYQGKIKSNQNTNSESEKAPPRALSKIVKLDDEDGDEFKKVKLLKKI